jgi:hypothetical protein
MFLFAYKNLYKYFLAILNDYNALESMTNITESDMLLNMFQLGMARYSPEQSYIKTGRSPDDAYWISKPAVGNI